MVERGVYAWRLFLGLGTAGSIFSTSMDEVDSVGVRGRLGMVVYDRFFPP